MHPAETLFGGLVGSLRVAELVRDRKVRRRGYEGGEDSRNGNALIVHAENLNRIALRTKIPM